MILESKSAGGIYKAEDCQGGEDIQFPVQSLMDVVQLELALKVRRTFIRQVKEEIFLALKGSKSSERTHGNVSDCICAFVSNCGSWKTEGNNVPREDGPLGLNSDKIYS